MMAERERHRQDVAKVEIRVLGPLEVWEGGAPVRIPGDKAQRLLAILAVRPGVWRSRDLLAEALWPADLPANPSRALATVVSRLRDALRSIGLDVEYSQGSYRLGDGADVDAVRFSELAAGDLSPAEREAALALWRSDQPFGEWGYDPVFEDEAERLLDTKGDVQQSAFGAAHEVSSGRVGPGAGLPSYHTSFVGRAGERKTLTDLISASRLVSVVGAPGIGKTRLVVEVLRAMPGMPGVRFVNVAGIHDLARLHRVVAEALGVSAVEVAGGDLERLPGEWTLMLDACTEAAHLLQALIPPMLANAPHLRIVMTSRVGSALVGVRRLRLGPLATRPLPGERWSDAASLFIDRLPERPPGESGLAEVERLVERLEGNPMAIETAAARGSDVPVDELMWSVWPANGSGAASAIDRSLALLSRDELAFLEVASVLRDGWTAHEVRSLAAEAGVGDVSVESVEPLRTASLLSLQEDDCWRVVNVVRMQVLDRLRSEGRLQPLTRALPAFVAGALGGVWPSSLTVGPGAIPIRHRDVESAFLAAAEIDVEKAADFVRRIYPAYLAGFDIGELQPWAEEILDRRPDLSPRSVSWMASIAAHTLIGLRPANFEATRAAHPLEGLRDRKPLPDSETLTAALGLVDLAERHAEEAGDGRAFLHARIVQARALYGAGWPAQALAALASVARPVDPVAAAILELHRVPGRALAGDVDHVDDVTDAVAARFGPETFIGAVAVDQRARAALQRGDHEGAWGVWRKALVATPPQHGYMRTYLQAACGLAALAGGARERAADDFAAGTKMALDADWLAAAGALPPLQALADPHGDRSVISAMPALSGIPAIAAGIDIQAGDMVLAIRHIDRTLVELTNTWSPQAAVFALEAVALALGDDRTAEECLSQAGWLRGSWPTLRLVPAAPAAEPMPRPGGWNPRVDPIVTLERGLQKLNEKE